MLTGGLLIIGWGGLGAAVAAPAVASGQTVVAVRRRPMDSHSPRLRVVPGDGAEDETWQRIKQAVSDLGQPISAVLFCATPGLRGGGPGNRLPEIAGQVQRHCPQAIVVYTGSTGVYTDSALPCRETAELAQHPRAKGLLAIENAVLQHSQGRVLRVGAIVGPDRGRSRSRVASAAVTVDGNPDRPFPYIHLSDLVTVCRGALEGAIGPGIWNTVAPHALSYREFYQGLAKAEGFGEVDITTSGAAAAERAIDGNRLHRAFAHMQWRWPWEPLAQ